MTCALACAGASLGTAAEDTPANYGVRLVGPVDGAGRLTRRHVPVGVPFWLKVELYTSGTDGAASVSYDLYMPTDFRVVLKRLRLPNGASTSSCLRACVVGWNSARSPHLFVYYALIPPVPAEFMVRARIVATNRKDTQRQGIDDRGSTTYCFAGQRTSRPRGATTRCGHPGCGPHLRGDRTGSARRCAGDPGRRSLRRDRSGSHASRHSNTRTGARWLLVLIPRDSAGTMLRTTVSVMSGLLRARTSWAYAIGASP